METETFELSMEEEMTQKEKENRERLRMFDGSENSWLNWCGIRYGSIEDFRKVLDETPLRRSDLEEFYLSGKTITRFRPLAWKWGSIKPLIKPFSFLVDVQENSGVEGITLVHEAMHGIYRFIGKRDYYEEDRRNPVTPQGKLDKLMEEELEKRAQVFYGGNKTFVDELVMKLTPFPYQEETEDPNQLELDFMKT